MSKRIRVRMADIKVGQADDIIITSGLGSCIGLTLYDSRTKVGGMAHIMLPKFPANKKKGNPAKYADTAIEMLLEQLESKGINKRRLEAKMAGGAQMFNLVNTNSKMRIGARNIEAVKEELNNYKIPLLGSEVGENYGRTMEFYTKTGEAKIKTVKHDDIIL
ncbi:chemotaxis protein [Halobacteroides halobius DSM 5150]|uniref:Probable chemoreceptor glutamine deamidase CheD n=1 Tax=Halobacteroides halobius (strain ATCC 35273 / DSM 5150 / MD-1) TaxID=748449 RepID=L0K6J5_HALHC|nr:chemotaxis protein CheD [Halobacteroides halobius]AGB40651.1 chemotaxis protein [Halobacteroides halobius DSM 5150]